MTLPINDSSVILFLGNLGSEVLVFVFCELIVRFIIPSPGTTSQKRKLLSIQFCLLSTSFLLLCLFHHTPFLLILIIVFVFGRIISLSGAEMRREDSISRDIHISSKPLGNNPFSQKASKLQWNEFHKLSSTPHFGTTTPHFGSLQAPTSSSLVHRHSSGSIPVSRHIHSLISPAAGGNSQYSTRNAKSTNSLSRSSDLSVGKNLLNQNALRGSTSETVLDAKPSGYKSYHTQLKQSHQQQQQQQGYLQYVSLFWGRPEPSTCPPGIYNSGNICFAISSLQVLAWTPDFINSLKTVCQHQGRSLSTPSEKLQLLCTLYTLLVQCHKLPDGTSVYNPVNCSEFLRRVSDMVPYLVASPQSGHRQTQQDASEFLLWLLDNLDGGGLGSDGSEITENELECAKQTKDKCLQQLKGALSAEISTFRGPLLDLGKTDWLLESQRASLLTSDLFLGQMVEARECQRCFKMSVNVEYFTLLTLPIPEGHSQLTIRDCFNSFGTVEELTSGNLMACSCSPVAGDSTEMILTHGKRIAMLSHLPRRLVIQLSRFSYNSLHKCAQKNAIPIRVPMILNLSPYLMETKLNSSNQPNKETKSIDYTLYAVCIHTGAQSTSFGHYVAYCRASNGSWYCFNDSYVTPVVNMEQELQESLLLENAYLLLYSSSSSSSSSSDVN